MKLKKWDVHPDCPTGYQVIVATVEKYTTESAGNVTGELVPYGAGFHLSLGHGREIVTRVITENDVRTDLSWIIGRLWGDLLEKMSHRQIKELQLAFGPDPLAWTIAERLNAMVKADPVAMHRLVEHRVPCDHKIVTDSPAVPVQGALLSLGMLGVINGLMPEGYKIVAKFDDNGKLIEFYPEGK